MSEDMQWNEFQQLAAVGEKWLRPGLAERVLAAAAQQRQTAKENFRVMAMATVTLAVLIFGVIEYDVRTAPSTNLAQWDDVATWVADLND